MQQNIVIIIITRLSLIFENSCTKSKLLAAYYYHQTLIYCQEKNKYWTVVMEYKQQLITYSMEMQGP